MLIRCAERRRLVEVFVKKVWKCPLSREPNGTDCLSESPAISGFRTFPVGFIGILPSQGKRYRIDLLMADPLSLFIYPVPIEGRRIFF